jgi:hypothetical protein
MEAIKDALQIDDNGALVYTTPSGGRHLIFAYDHSSEPIGLTVRI